ncbi:5S rRNA maturation endonuclease (ribonuclease M5) [Lysinibacillus sp. RC46]|uniref:DUF2399 domain-containing protein n=1 Tax=unclassified Lysinibacillus TaxID=2636778 RepID=UPI003516B3FE
MIEQFLTSYFVKNGEHLEVSPKYITDTIKQYTVVKQTARTYRNVSFLKVGQLTKTKPSQELLNYKFTKNAKRNLTEDFSTIQSWIEEGWIIEEIVFAQDGRTAKAIHYRIGPSLKCYFEAQNEQQTQRLENYALQLQKSANILPIKELQHAVQQLNEFVSMPIEKLAHTTKLMSHWSIEKRLRFLHFSIGFFQLANEGVLFDFKEIGATLFDKIGGSKVFDREQKEFIEELERVFSVQTGDCGLISLGKITPVFFAGELTGTFSHYQQGVIHALTDDAILKDTYKTEANIIWLVENRAILTRMAKETSFLQITNSFILCLDGQIRSAHKMLIRQIVATQTVIVWTDFDSAGLTIAMHAVQMINTPYKIIARDNQIFSDIEVYKNWLLGELEVAEHEQEQQLGDVEQWMKWIQ